MKIELPIDRSSGPSAAEPGVVSDDEACRIYDTLEQGPRLDDPIRLREPQEHESAIEVHSIVLQGFSDTSLSGKYPPIPPVIGQLGELKM